MDFWVGVRLCKRYGLKEWGNELRQLKSIYKEVELLEPELSKPAALEPAQFIEVTGSSKRVIVRMSDLKVNAANIVTLSGRRTDAIKRLKKGWVPGDYELDIPIRRIRARM